MGYLAKFYRDGGEFMHFISIVAFYIIGASIYKIAFLMFKFNTNGKALMKQIQKLVMANNVDKAIKLCAAAGDSALANVLKAGLTRANRGEMEIQNAMEEATLEVTPKLTQVTDSIYAIGNVATLVGLLGTIFGLIECFDAVSKAAPEQKSAMLAAGISLAMNATAYGLACAIVAIVIHLFLRGVTSKIFNEIDLYSLKLINMLTSREKGTASTVTE